MDTIVKKKVMNWIDTKITEGDTCFDVWSCIKDIGLDPLDKNDYTCVEEIFEWHQSLINRIYDVCFEENT
jgi:hypothetical protein